MRRLLPPLARRAAHPAALRRHARPLQPAPRPALRRLPLRPRLPGRHRRALQRPRHQRPPLRRRASARFVQQCTKPDRPKRHRPGSYSHAKRRQDAEAIWARGGTFEQGLAAPWPTRPRTSTASASPTSAPSAAGGRIDAICWDRPTAERRISCQSQGPQPSGRRPRPDGLQSKTNHHTSPPCSTSSRVSCVELISSYMTRSSYTASRSAGGRGGTAMAASAPPG